MTAGTSKEKEADPVLVKGIVNKLKSGGSFDQFRREFIADVDTKPAYQNLQQRVESYVTRFLNQQVWSPKLNKNQLRENLRRQINQSGMLNKGVERIIEQVVNPKIMQIIKPKIDEVVCDHLGISLEDRNNRLKQKQLEQQEKMLRSPESGGIASLMSITFTSPPPGVKASPFASTNSPAAPPSQFPQVPPSSSSGILGPAPVQFPPHMGFPNPPAASLPFPNLNQQTFPFLPPGWNVSMNAGFPPIFPPANQIGAPFQDFSVPPPGTGLTIPPPAAGGIPQAAVTIPPVSGAIPPAAGPIPPAAGGLLLPPMPLGSGLGLTAPVTTAAVTKPSPGKGLNALLGLPTPSEEPPPPGTVVLPDGSHVRKIWKPEFTDSTEEKSVEIVEESIEIKEERNDIEKNEIDMEPQETEVILMEDIPLPEDSKQEHEDEQSGVGEVKRYKFAWDEDIDVGSEIEDDASSHISSVHTSDLSNFEESMSSSESDVEELENKLLLLQKEQEDDDEAETVEEMPDLESERSLDEKTDTSAGAAKPDENTLPDVTVVVSPIKQPPVLEPIETAHEGSDKREMAAKPRKLLSLQYNYSDSEDEESREDRKARIAKEKEERYLKRLQRRADLDAKRKEREEEKNRQRRERLERAKEKVEKEKLEREKVEQEKQEVLAVPEVLAALDKVEVVEDVPKTEGEESKAEGNTEAECEINDKTALQVDELEVEKSKEEETVETEKRDVGEIADTKADVDTVDEEKPEPTPQTVRENDVSQAEAAPEQLEPKEETNTSVNTDNSHNAESSVAVDTSLSDTLSPEKKTSKQRKKTKAELKAELKEQKVLERRSRRQRIRNRRYMSDEFVFKSPSASLCQSYDETMVIEETVEMEITTDDMEPQTVELDTEEVHLLEIPLPDDQHQEITMETVEFTEVSVMPGGEEVVTITEGEEFYSEASTPTEGVKQQLPDGSTDYTEGVAEYEVTSADITAREPGRITRSRSKFNDDIKSNSSEVSDHSQEGKRRRRRNTSQSSSGEPPTKRVSAREGRQLRSSDNKNEKHSSKTAGSKQSYENSDLYKPRHSFSRRSAPTPPPLPAGLPPLPKEPSPPPLPPLPPPPAENEDLPALPTSPLGSEDDKGERRNRSRRNSKGSRSSISSDSYSGNSRSKSKKDKKPRRSRSRSLSSISSDSKVSRSRSKSRSRSSSRSRSYSRSRSRTKSSSRSRSVSRSRSRSFSTVSSKRSSFSGKSDLSDSERERRRKARPLEDVDFGEAAKRSRQDSMMMPFGPRGPVGPMGPRMPMGPMGPRGPMVPGPFPPGRGMSPMGVRGPRGVVRGWFPSPQHFGPDGSPIRPSPPPGMSPGKPFYPPGAPRFMPPGPSWEGPMGGRPRTDEYYMAEDIHEGPGKTGITERGTLYREDTSPSPPPDRRPVYSPPPGYREDSRSPIPTGITERGTLYREDKSPTPPSLYRGRRIERSPSPTLRSRLRTESLTPSPPPVTKHRTRSSRSDSFESISPSPPPITRARPVSPVQQGTPPVQRNTPPVLYKPRVNIASSSPPSSGELTPSPPDISQINRGRPSTPPSPISPNSLRSVSPASNDNPASPRELSTPIDSITPTPSVGSNEGMLSSPEEGSYAERRRKRQRSPVSPMSSVEESSPPELRRSVRNQELAEVGTSSKKRKRKSSEGHSKMKTRKSKRSKKSKR